MTGFDNITVADVNKMQYLYKQYACLGLLSLLEDTLIQSDKQTVSKDILLKDPTGTRMNGFKSGTHILGVEYARTKLAETLHCAALHLCASL